MMTTTSTTPPPASGHADYAEDTEDAGLGTASVVLGVLGFFPVPGAVASVLAIALGIAARKSPTPGPRTTQRAALGICLGAVSLACFGAVCFVYFVLLGYPLPHIARYHPEH